MKARSLCSCDYLSHKKVHHSNINQALSSLSRARGSRKIRFNTPFRFFTPSALRLTISLHIFTNGLPEEISTKRPYFYPMCRHFWMSSLSAVMTTSIFYYSCCKQPMRCSTIRSSAFLSSSCFSWLYYSSDSSSDPEPISCFADFIVLLFCSNRYSCLA